MVSIRLKRMFCVSQPIALKATTNAAPVSPVAVVAMTVASSPEVICASTTTPSSVGTPVTGSARRPLAVIVESLTVAPTEDASLSRMTLVTSGDEAIIEQITKQLNKLVDVIKLVDLNDGPRIERELMLIKLRTANADLRAEFKRLTDIFGGTIVDITDVSYTVELSGSSAELDDFIEAAEGSLSRQPHSSSSFIFSLDTPCICHEIF